MQAAKGKVFKFGEDINTDVILPGKYLNLQDPAQLALHCMESEDPEFVNKAKPGDIMVAGKNFGCGSSREQAPVALKNSGIECIVAKSFSRIFYRSAINIGLPIIECEEAAREICEGDEVTVDFDSGVITDHTLGKQWQAAAFPAFLQNLIAAGGLVEYSRAKINK